MNDEEILGPEEPLEDDLDLDEEKKKDLIDPEETESLDDLADDEEVLDKEDLMDDIEEM